MTDVNTDAVDSPPQKQDAYALELILAERPGLYCDIVGQPRIRLPPARDHPLEEPWNLRSERVRAWIAEFIWEKARVVLLDREIDRILNILVGKAWLDQRRDLELCDAIEQEPLLEALLLFVKKEGRYEGTMTKLLKEIVKVARRAGLDVKAKSWPKGSPQLSNRIRSLEHFLAKAQISVRRERNGFERTIILEPQIQVDNQTNDGGPSSPSLDPSVDKSHHPKNQRQNDADDPEKRASIFARITQPEEGKGS